MASLYHNPQSSRPLLSSTVTPSPQCSVSGSDWGASKFLKSITLSSLGNVVANNNTNGSRSYSPASRHSLDSLPISSVPVPTSGTVERLLSFPPPTSLQTVIHAFRLPVTGRPSNTSTSNQLPWKETRSAHCHHDHMLLHRSLQRGRCRTSGAWKKTSSTRQRRTVVGVWDRIAPFRPLQYLHPLTGPPACRSTKNDFWECCCDKCDYPCKFYARRKVDGARAGNCHGR